MPLNSLQPPGASLTLKREIRFSQLFAIGFGTMIGVGWIIMAGRWILDAGPGGAIVAFAIGAIAVMVVGLLYGEMGAAYPHSGGEIVYVYAGLGTGAAFFIGWTLTLIYIAVVAFEAIATPWMVATLIPAIQGPVLYTLLGSEVTQMDLVISLGGLAALTWVNLRGGLASASFQNVATWLFLVASLVFVMAALSRGSEVNRLPWFESDRSGSWIGAIIAVLATVPVWYSGFNTLPQALGEVSDTGSLVKIPKVLVAAVFAGFLFFVGVILATSSALSRADIAAADLPVAAALFSLFDTPWLGRLVLFAGLMGIVTSWNAVLFSGARVLFCLGRAKIITDRFSRVQRRFGSPSFAILFVGLIAVPLILVGKNSLTPIINVVGLAYAVCYLVVAVSLIRLRKLQPELPRPYRMPGHPWLTWSATLLAASFIALAAYNIWHGRTLAFPAEFIALIFWLILGICVWFLSTKTRTSITHERRTRLIHTR